MTRPTNPPTSEPDPQDRAEALDGDRLGESVDDESRPGTDGFPPTEPLGVDDPIDPDGGPEPVAERDARHRDDEPATAGTRLVAPDGGTGVPDDEAQEIADDVAETATISPEEAAVRTLDDGG